MGGGEPAAGYICVLALYGSTKAADGLFERRRIRKNATRPAIRPRNTTPPTTPPAMAPVLDLWTAPEAGAVEAVELGPVVTELVTVTGSWVDTDTGVAVVDAPKVDCIGGLDSGAVSSSLAALALKVPVMVTSRYAHAGNVVFWGIVAG